MLAADKPILRCSGLGAASKRCLGGGRWAGYISELCVASCVALQAKALAPNSASEMRMAHAVAEATAAAAAAASAAASAASTCQVSVQRFRQPPSAPRLEAPRA